MKFLTWAFYRFFAHKPKRETSIRIIVSPVMGCSRCEILEDAEALAKRSENSVLVYGLNVIVQPDGSIIPEPEEPQLYAKKG